jgi:uncharacterized membrane protein YidH (DUF202 family)
MASEHPDHGSAQTQNFAASEPVLAQPVSSSPTPAQPFRRNSSVQFSRDTKAHSQSPMSSSFVRSKSDTDESTPIKALDGHSDRRYNTSDGYQPRSRATPSNTDSSDPISDTLVNSSRDNIPQDIDEEEKKESWLRKIADKCGSITLENKGSVARDHLALERTFLAWLRTSLAFASIGIAVTQLFRLNTSIQSRSVSLQKMLPFSPLVGHTIPHEMVQFLQASMPAPAASLGPTLLDQLLGLPPGDLPRRDLDSLAPRNGVELTSNQDAAAKLRHMGKPLGATFLAISIVILLIGGHRYFESQYWIIRGKFPASRGSIFTVTFITASVIITSFAVVLAVAPTSHEKN